MSSILEGRSTSEKIEAALASRMKCKKDLARMLDVTPRTIHNHMVAERWSVIEIRTISRWLNIDPKDLI